MRIAILLIILAVLTAGCTEAILSSNYVDTGDNEEGESSTDSYVENTGPLSTREASGDNNTEDQTDPLLLDEFGNPTAANDEQIVDYELLALNDTDLATDEVI